MDELATSRHLRVSNSDDDDSGCAMEEYAWTPPGLKRSDLVHKYFSKLPEEKVPLANSIGERYRIRQMLLQLPPHDSDPRFCQNLSDAELKEFMVFSAGRKEKAFGKGNAQQLATDSVCTKCAGIIPAESIAVYCHRIDKHAGCHSSAPVVLSPSSSSVSSAVMASSSSSAALSSSSDSSASTATLKTSQGAQPSKPAAGAVDNDCSGATVVTSHIVATMSLPIETAGSLPEAEIAQFQTPSISLSNSTVRGGYFHPACFTCHKCSELLVDFTYFINGDELYCGRHYCELIRPRCAACDEIIFADECTEAEGRSWHMHHFLCTQCEHNLAGQRYLLHDGHPYCCTCFETLYAELCDTCGDPIGIDQGQMAHGGQHWHATPECFCCQTCHTSLLGKVFLPKFGAIFCCTACSRMCTLNVGLEPNNRHIQQPEKISCLSACAESEELRYKTDKGKSIPSENYVSEFLCPQRDVSDYLQYDNDGDICNAGDVNRAANRDVEVPSICDRLSNVSSGLEASSAPAPYAGNGSRVAPGGDRSEVTVKYNMSVSTTEPPNFSIGENASISALCQEAVDLVSNYSDTANQLKSRLDSYGHWNNISHVQSNNIVNCNSRAPTDVAEVQLTLPGFMGFGDIRYEVGPARDNRSYRPDITDSSVIPHTSQASSRQVITEFFANNSNINNTAVSYTPPCSAPNQETRIAHLDTQFEHGGVLGLPNSVTSPSSTECTSFDAGKPANADETCKDGIYLTYTYPEYKPGNVSASTSPNAERKLQPPHCVEQTCSHHQVNGWANQIKGIDIDDTGYIKIGGCSQFQYGGVVKPNSPGSIGTSVDQAKPRRSADKNVIEQFSPINQYADIITPVDGSGSIDKLCGHNDNRKNAGAFTYGKSGSPKWQHLPVNNGEVFTQTTTEGLSDILAVAGIDRLLLSDRIDKGWSENGRSMNSDEGRCSEVSPANSSSYGTALRNNGQNAEPCGGRSHHEMKRAVNGCRPVDNSKKWENGSLRNRNYHGVVDSASRVAGIHGQQVLQGNFLPRHEGKSKVAFKGSKRPVELYCKTESGQLVRLAETEPIGATENMDLSAIAAQSETSSTSDASEDSDVFWLHEAGRSITDINRWNDQPVLKARRYPSMPDRFNMRKSEDGYGGKHQRLPLRPNQFEHLTNPTVSAEGMATPADGRVRICYVEEDSHRLLNTSSDEHPGVINAMILTSEPRKRDKRFSATDQKSKNDGSQVHMNGIGHTINHSHLQTSSSTASSSTNTTTATGFSQRKAKSKNCNIS